MFYNQRRTHLIADRDILIFFSLRRCPSTFGRPGIAARHIGLLFREPRLLSRAQ